MTPTTTDVELPTDLVEKALQLTPAQRRKLGNILLDSTEAPPDDPELVRKEWNALIAERIKGYLDGTIPTVDAEEALAEVERRFEEKHPQ